MYRLPAGSWVRSSQSKFCTGKCLTSKSFLVMGSYRKISAGLCESFNNQRSPLGKRVIPDTSFNSSGRAVRRGGFVFWENNKQGEIEIRSTRQLRKKGIMHTSNFVSPPLGKVQAKSESVTKRVFATTKIALQFGDRRAKYLWTDFSSMILTT